MRTTRARFLWPLLGLLGVLAPALAYATCQEITVAQIDGFLPQYVQSGRDTGELEGWKHMAFHPMGVTIGYDWHRIQDSRGTPIQTDSNNTNSQSFSVGSTNLLDPCATSPQIPGPGCWQDGVNAGLFPTSDYNETGSWNIERQLLNYVSDPGVYQFHWTITENVNHTTQQYTTTAKHFHMEIQDYPCTFYFKDDQGNFIPNCHVDILRPWNSADAIVGDSAGVSSTLRFPAQTYLCNVRAPSGYQSVNNYTWRIVDDPQKSQADVITFICPRTGQASNYNTGQVIARIINQTTQNIISDRTGYITYGGKTYTTTTGSVIISNTQGGSNVQFTGAAQGFYTNTIYQTINMGGSTTVTIPLSVNLNDPGGGTTGGTTGGGSGNVLDSSWWTNLFQTLFVPKSTTTDAWKAQVDTMTSWGPFGVAKQFLDVWNNPGTVSGAQAAVWSANFSGTSQYSMPLTIDLRPKAGSGVGSAPGTAYPDGATGTDAGTWVGTFRKTLGVFLWVCFLFAVLRWARPTMTT